MPTNTDNIRVELTAWPTANPTWNGAIWDLSANKELVSATLSFGWDNPYTGNIHETLTRPDVWECVGVRIVDPDANMDRQAMIQALKETLARDVRTVLLKVDPFYPQLECRAEAEALLAADRSYEAMVKLTGEIPRAPRGATRRTSARPTPKASSPGAPFPFAMSGTCRLATWSSPRR